MKVNNVVICAAGLGSRLGLDTPKCLVKIGNHPLIYYLLNSLKDIPNIRIVVGFKEEEVIQYVKSIRRDVVFIRNPNYRNTTNSYSLYLGSNDLDEPFVNIDGDMYISSKNLNKFFEEINSSENLIVVTKAYTEDAVFIKLDNNNNAIEFSRDRISDYEWTGIAHFSDIKIRKEGAYVYQELEDKLPIKTIDIECFEVDTPRDLEILSNKIGEF